MLSALRRRLVVSWVVSLSMILSPLVGASAQAQGASLSLEEAKELSLKTSEDFQIKDNEILRRQAQVREAWGSIFPQIAAEARWQKYFKSPVFFGNTVPIEYQFESGVSVQQVLWAFGRVGGALKAAKAGLKIGELDKTSARHDIIFQVSMAYYTALLAQDQLRISRQTLQNAKDNLAILDRKFSGGRAPQGDLVRLRSDVAVRTSQLMTAEAEYQEALLALAQMTELKDIENVKLTTDFKTDFVTLNEAELQKKLEENQPKLALLKQQINYSEQVAKIQNAGSYPTLSAFGSYSYSGASDRSNIGSDNLHDSTAAGVLLTWNLWDGGQTRARYKQAVVDKANAELTLAKTRENLQLELDRAITQYNTLVSSYKISREAVDLAEKSFKISQNRFRTGQASVTEVNSTEAALTQARLGLTLNTYGIHSSLVTIENIIASPEGNL